MILTRMVDAHFRQLRGRQWLKENCDAIDSYNRDVEEHGTFSDGLRTF